MKKVLVAVTTLALTLGLPVGGNAVAAQRAQRGFVCQISGTASFEPGLSATQADGKYTFSGQLSGCQGTDSSATSATVKASGSGNVSCAQGTTTGTAQIKFNNHKKVTVSISTTDVGALVQVTAKVTKSNEPAVEVGDTAYSVLAFNADPYQCAYGGVDGATFQGVVAGGSPS